MTAGAVQTASPSSVSTFLVVISSMGRAGAETQAVDLANGLAAKGHSVHFCCFGPNLDQRDRLLDQVRFHHVPRNSKLDISLPNRLAAIIDRERIEVVLGVLQFATLMGWLAARRSSGKPPVVSAIHTTISRGRKDEIYNRLLYRRLLRRMAAIIFVCEHQRNYWMRKYPDLKGKSVVVHNGVAPGRFRYEEFAEAGRQLRADLGVPNDSFLLSAVAAFRPEKGHKILIDAFEGVRGEPYLIFAGDGGLRTSMEAYTAAAGLRARTRFLGNIPDTRPLIAASNATVLASTAVETFSMAMLESMAMGVPMIAPQIGGLPEAIIHGETGLLFPIADRPALARCIQSMVDRRARAREMGRAAAVKVTEDFTLEKMVSSTEGVLTGVLKKGARLELTV